MSGPPQNLNHFQGDKSISMLSSLLNLTNLAVCSDVLSQSWKAICETKDQFSNQLPGDLNVQFREKKLPTERYNIIVFVTPPITKSCLLEKTESVSISKSTVSGFEFLLPSKTNSRFSINETALSLFHSCQGELSEKIDKIVKEDEPKPYIITGDGMGGSVASLFTLHLLKSLDTIKDKPPLCVTFGSPLLGDSGFQEAISEHTTWKSRFLHVVSKDDCFPGLFVQPNHPGDGQTTNPIFTYHPFGRFMFCSNSDGACFEDPESALDLLKKMNADGGGNEESFDYNSLIENLRRGLICKDITNLNAHGTGLSSGGVHVAAQCLAGLFQLQDVARNSQLLGLLEKEVSVLKQKRDALDEKAKELNESKINMTRLEWYKKRSEKNKAPYYDRYKSQLHEVDTDARLYIKQLQIYWKRHVNEAAENPQKEGTAFRNRWLLAGTTYRKLVEPFAIADYYRKGAKNYITEGRLHESLKHYKILERWFNEDAANENRENQNAPPSLTDDSCFWAHVEEAIISCQKVSKGESTSSEIEKLIEFEKYVFRQIRDYKVSSDIFLGKSSFMIWWEDYKRKLDQKLMDASYTSPLAEIMHEQTYRLYESGKLFH